MTKKEFIKALEDQFQKLYDETGFLVDKVTISWLQGSSGIPGQQETSHILDIKVHTVP